MLFVVHTGISLEDKPNINRWVAAIDARPAVVKGLDVPVPNMIKAAQKEAAAKKAAQT